MRLPRLCNHILMNSENNLTPQPTKASKNKSSKALFEIFTFIFYFIVLIFLKLTIFIAVFAFPFSIIYFYNYYLDHKALPLHELLIYFLGISVIILLSLWAVRKYGAKNFWGDLTWNTYISDFAKSFEKSGGYLKWFVYSIGYFIIFMLIMTILIVALRWLFTK
jgi:Na+/melibiose symporter-like transporter